MENLESSGWYQFGTDPQAADFGFGITSGLSVNRPRSGMVCVAAQGHSQDLLIATTQRVSGSKPYCGPLLDLDPGHENRLTLAIRTKYQRLTIRQTGRQLRKCTRDVREVGHNDRVCAGWKLCHLLLQPRGLDGRPTLHALTIITKFGEDLRAPN
jgi:hypothetical protein